MSPPTDRDPDYYNVPLVILVESTLFKVSRRYFENSDVFRKTYLFGPEGEDMQDGRTDKQPLRLDGVDAGEFRCLLKAMIREDPQDMSWVEWISVLKLSLMWQMELIHKSALQKIKINNTDEWITALQISTQLRIKGVRDLAIQNLRSLSSWRKLELGAECGIVKWLLEVYLEFVMRFESISLEEEERLGRNRTANLFRLRYLRLKPSGYGKLDIKSNIRTVFASEFADMAALDHSPVSYLRSELHTATDPGVIQRDNMFYHIDIIFSVENTLFQLPRYMFEEHSQIFRDMFLLPPPEDVSCDGSDDEHPLFLHGVRKTAFRQLIVAMKFQIASEQLKFNPGKGEDTKSEAARTHLQECVSALELTCMWQMAQVRKNVVKEIFPLLCEVCTMELVHLLTQCDKLEIPKIRDQIVQFLSNHLQPIELIKIAMELPVYSLFVHGYARLVLQDGGISTEEEELLGWKTTSTLFRIRDEHLRDNRLFSHVSRSDVVMGEIETKFAEELRDAIWR